MMIEKASGISTPPANPCRARTTIIWPRLVVKAQATVITRKARVLTNR